MISVMIHKLVWKSCILSSFAQPHQILTNSPQTTQLCSCNMLNVIHVSLKLLLNTSNKIQQKIQILKCRCYFYVACDSNKVILFQWLLKIPPILNNIFGQMLYKKREAKIPIKNLKHTFYEVTSSFLFCMYKNNQMLQFICKLLLLWKLIFRILTSNRK